MPRPAPAIGRTISLLNFLAAHPDESFSLSELARRLDGTGVTANCLHPGMVATSIWSGAPWWARPVLELGKRSVMVSPAEGGARLTYLALDPAVEGVSGGYYDGDRLTEPSTVARNDSVARRLWDESLRLVGLAT